MEIENEIEIKVAENLNKTYLKIQEELGKVIVGAEETIKQIFIAMLCKGHAILEGTPGLAKTKLISTLSQISNLDFQRIQFTPDLMPSDITGSEVLEEDRSTGKKVFRFVEGPLFANIILADEINRTPPKTQSALLEAMEERQVTVSGKTCALPDPFFVLATQNPIEHEGTYPLPEAQLDRFIMKVVLPYPNMENEIEIMKRVTTTYSQKPEQVISKEDLFEIQDVVRKIPVPQHVYEYVARLVYLSRPGESNPSETAKEYISWGAGPRASIFLILTSKVLALLSGRFHVTTEDIKEMAIPVLRHRIIPSFSAESSGIHIEQIINKLIEDADKYVNIKG